MLPVHMLASRVLYPDAAAPPAAVDAVGDATAITPTVWGLIAGAFAFLIGYVKISMARENARTDKADAARDTAYEARVGDLQKALDYERARADRMEAENRDLNKQNTDKVVPALLASAEMTRSAVDLIRDANRGPR